MTNSNLLNQYIQDSGLKKMKIAELLGITLQSLSRKTNNETEFKQSEIKILCETLGINTAKEINAVFFV
jgi:predicted XRE-type DNA-binding protein